MLYRKLKLRLDSVLTICHRAHAAGRKMLKMVSKICTRARPTRYKSDPYFGVEKIRTPKKIALNKVVTRNPPQVSPWLVWAQCAVICDRVIT